MMNLIALLGRVMIDTGLPAAKGEKQIVIKTPLAAVIFLVVAVVAGMLGHKIQFDTQPVEPTLAPAVTIPQSDVSLFAAENTGQNHRSVLYWRTPKSAGVSPLGVLRATREQMERDQQSELGSDQNAKALVLVMRAIAELEGRAAETADGTPIIE